MQDQVRRAFGKSNINDREKHRSQLDRILTLLRERGAAGATNVELNAICFRYGARLWELRKAGYNIRTESLGDGLYRFTLLSEPVKATRLHTDKSPIEPETPLSLIAGAGQ